MQLAPNETLLGESAARFVDDLVRRDTRTSGTQIVYDLDDVSDETVIEELMASEQYLVFGPDTLPEARNRGYRHRSI